MPHKATQVRRAQLDRWGYTEGSLKCQDMLNNSTSAPTRGHSKACRERMLEAMRTDPSLLRRIEDAEKRKTEYLEQRDKQRAEPSAVAPAAGPVSIARNTL